jgi:hypothetical protein
MKIRRKWAGNVGAVAKTALCLALAVIMVGMSVTPVLARDDDRDHRRDNHYRHDRHYRHDGYNRTGYYPPRGYYGPPPPVVYAPPPPPPGITLVFPLRFR